jgi:ribonuclease J
VVVMEKQTGKFISGPDIVTRGFVYVRESEHILEEAKKRATVELEAIEKRNITEWSLIKSRLKNVLTDYFYEATGRRPIILPIIIEI